MIDGSTLIFSSDDICWEGYSSVSSTKKTKVQSVPILHIRVKEQDILFRGRRLINKFLGAVLDGWSDLPNELRAHMMGEHEWLAGEEDAPRFVDEIASLKGSSLAVSVSVVGDTTPTNQAALGLLGTVFMVKAIHARPTEQGFNIGWLSDYIASPLHHGFTEWVGSSGKKVVPVAYADISIACGMPASLVIYDFGRSYGVTSRLNIGVRPHRLIEVRRGQGEIHHLKSATIHSYKKCVELSRKTEKSAQWKKSVGNHVDRTTLRSLEVDELEFSLSQTLFL